LVLAVSFFQNLRLFQNPPLSFPRCSLFRLVPPPMSLVERLITLLHFPIKLFRAFLSGFFPLKFLLQRLFVFLFLLFPPPVFVLISRKSSSFVSGLRTCFFSHPWTVFDRAAVGKPPPGPQPVCSGTLSAYCSSSVFFLFVVFSFSVEKFVSFYDFFFAYILP